ncbi:MAG TPA: SDR family oxidoreductase [Alphaproteobacteria bacterium]|jgi:3-oxoacyl-[acyl-carrier protein] reductase|nr:SDR family oxidoreductase [Alphaproteobacteria bacterium]
MDSEIESAFGLEGRTAVVTGAASGIGRQAAITLAKAGAHVVLADLNPAGLEETRAAVEAFGGRADVRETDMTDRDHVERLADFAVERGGRIDVWANIAGIILTSMVVDSTEDQLDRVFAVNMKGTYWGCAAAARRMMAQGSGSIVNISSAGADFPAPGLSIYAMTKSAVSMLTRTLAHEAGPRGVRVNAIAPGFIDTPMIEYRYRTPDGDIDTQKKAALLADRAKGSVLGITGEPQDIAYAILYLASDAAKFVTGQVLRPNGGVAMPA